MSQGVNIRPARVEDAPLLLEWIKKLAEYERLDTEVVATEQALVQTLFGPKPFAAALLAFMGGKAAGFAVYYFAFSTFKARPVLYIEDLFVEETRRGSGIGRKLFLELLKLAEAEGCARIEWSVLDWNQPARRFYEKLGAEWKPPWLRYELPASAFENAAEKLGD